MAVADDMGLEPGRSVAARIAVERRGSDECMMLCVDAVASVVFFHNRERCSRQNSNSTCLKGDKTEVVFCPMSSEMEPDKGIEFH